MSYLLDLVDKATSALAEEVKYLVDYNKKNKKKVAKATETLEEKTKRLITDDQKQWLRFKEVMRKKGIVTNGALTESFYFYMQYRDAEDSIDGCIDKWKQTENRLNHSLSRIRSVSKSPCKSSMPVVA